MKLLIVESPAKCKKINSLLGKDYIVLATGGHINRLNGLKSIDIKNNFHPTYSLIYDKMKYLNYISQKAKSVDEVIIGTDLDREGEAIGYHIANYLKLDINKTKRIVYNEISKSALTNAIKNPTKINNSIVNSQKSRQIIDLMVGYHLSPLLWKYIQDYLSAGRCQSPALRLIYDNDIEIKKNVIKSYFHISGIFNNPKYKLEGDIDKKFKENEINSILEKIKKNKDHIYISKIDKSNKKINPPYPFITSSIQQELSKLFHLSGKASMSILQKLYESGKITYIRTDSYSIAKSCSMNIKKYIEEKYGEDYYKYRTYGNKQNSQEAHECIRPVNINMDKLDGDDLSSKVYNLIWKRTVESQMSSYEYDEYRYTISIDNFKYDFISKINNTTFLGFKINGKKEDNIELINKINLNDKLDYEEINCLESLDDGVKNYTEGTLIKKLETLGIGRPSTYATIISTLFDKKYIDKINIPSKNINKKYIQLKNDNITSDIKQVKTKIEKNRIIISDLGSKVIKFLIDNFDELLSYDYTNKLENNLDDISNNKLDYIDFIDNTYKSYYPIVKKLNKKEKKEIEKRLLGTHKSKKVYIYMSKYGPTVELCNSKTKKYVNLDKKTNINNVELKNIKDLLDLPKKIGKYKDKEIVLKKGQYGYYLTYNKNNYSLKRIKNPIKISLDKAIEIINT